MILLEIAIIPGFLISKIVSDEERGIHLNMLFSSIFILVILRAFSRFPDSPDKMPHFCIFKKLFGIPCPGCGMIRSLFHAARLNIEKSFRQNPLGIPLVTFFALQIPIRVFALVNPETMSRLPKHSRVLSNTITKGLLIVWMVKTVALEKCPDSPPSQVPIHGFK